MSKEYTIETLLDKLVGSTEPYGETNHDEKALERLDDVWNILNWAIGRLSECRKAKNNYQSSMIALAKKAREIAYEEWEWLRDLSIPSEKEKENE
mgnify:CR=1 FL=1